MTTKQELKKKVEEIVAKAKKPEDIQVAAETLILLELYAREENLMRLVHRKKKELEAYVY